MTQAVSVSFFRFEGIAARCWAFGQMQFARGPLRRLPDIGFVKMFGTGTGEGFTPLPNFGVYALMATWPSLEIAQARIRGAAVYHRYQRHAVEHATVFLTATKSRGLWDGQPPFTLGPEQSDNECMAVLTRATLKKRHIFKFWRHTPAVSQTIRDQSNLLFKIGMGEVPWFQQVTFSIWNDAERMRAFAYKSASHAAAIKDVRAHGWFKEELYAHFRILAAEGQWDGKPFLAPVSAHAAMLPGKTQVSLANENVLVE